MNSSKHVRRQIFRLLGVLFVLFCVTVPVVADEGCEEYCQGFCAGWCAALGKICYYQGCEGGPGNYQCYFGCIPKPD